MKIYQGQQGQFGDAIISLRVSEELHKKYPDAEIVTGVSKKYDSIIPLLKTAPYINRVIEWDGYCEYTDKDKQFIEQEKFDLFYCPFQPSTPDFWRQYHQMADAFVRHGLETPEDLKINLPRFTKTKFGNEKYTVCISLSPNNGEGIKALSKDRIQSIINYLYNKYDVQVIVLDNKIGLYVSWLATAGWLCNCDLLITGDTGVSWLASAYNVPTLGLYAFGYYSGATTSKNWQPINPKAVYLEDYSVNDIKLETIEESIDALLNI